MDIFNSAARIADKSWDHRTSPLLKALADKSEFSLVTEAQMPEKWSDPQMSFANLAPVIGKRSDAPPQLYRDRALTHLEEILDEIRDNYFGPTRPDNEVIFKQVHQVGTWSEHRFLSVATKNNNAFCPTVVRHALMVERCINKELLKNLPTGHIPLRKALKAHANREAPIAKSDRFVYESCAQEWRYMAQRGQKWGFVTSATASIVLMIDWKADRKGREMKYFLFVPGTFAFETCFGAHTPNVTDIVTILGSANLKVGVQSNETILALSKEIVEAADTYEPSNSSTDKSGSTADRAAEDDDELPDSPYPPEFGYLNQLTKILKTPQAGLLLRI